MDWDPPEEIIRHLDISDDPTLLILRVHLLIEERLRGVLARICRAPEELGAARLTFHQVLCLCRAIVARHDEPIWDFVTRLNKVRNTMAHHLHRLEPGDLDGLLGSVAERLKSDYAAERLATPLERFRLAALFACAYFDAIRGGIRLREAYASEEEYAALMDELDDEDDGNE